MTDSLSLLDTPKKLSLSSRSADLRTALKEWEKSFATSHAGQKPGKDDIKSDADVARKYKEYNKLRDVLAGRLGVEALDEQRSPRHERKRSRADSAISFTPRRGKFDGAKNMHPSSLDPYDAPPSASPRPFLHAIGPTPQRDGRVLGLFDMLSNSGRSSQATPSSRKRKYDALSYDHGTSNAMPQTPAERRKKQSGDLLQHLDSEFNTSESGQQKHSRTPVSDGKKFMLSQFFATPNTMQYTALADTSTPKELASSQTPLRDQILRQTPAKDLLPDQNAVDATPAYLKRTFSFKDRLLSASTTGAIKANQSARSSPELPCRRPRTFERTRSMPKSLSQIIQDLRTLEDGDLDDDLDALREIEGNTANIQVSSSQENRPANDFSGFAEQQRENVEPQAAQTEQPRTWKKKGQKRTTKRSVMRPSKMKPKEAPRFVAADDEREDDYEEADLVEETQPAPRLPSYNDLSDAELQVDGDYLGEDDQDAGEWQSKKCNKKPKSKSKDKAKKKQAGTINPNALSHQNFRSLKIRNKNSKAKKGGGRFGRGRR